MRKGLAIASVALAVALGTVLAGPAHASQGGVGLRTGDTVCTDQTRSDSGARFTADIINGRGTVSIRTATSAGGPETVVWSAANQSSWVNQTVAAAAPGTYFRGCVTITQHFSSNTWTRTYLYGQGSGTASDLGPHVSSLSPGAWACGDFGEGASRLTGSASGSAQWYINAMDIDYASVGAVFFANGTSVNTVFNPDASLTVLEMCVRNTSTQKINVSFELSAA